MNTLKKWTDAHGEGYGFKCPGCGDTHHVRTINRTDKSFPVWGFNGNEEAPTFTPSVLVKSGHFGLGQHKDGDECWCRYYREHPEQEVHFTCYVCHSFVTHGRIQFLSDCTHPLRGQTVSLTPICEGV